MQVISLAKTSERLTGMVNIEPSALRAKKGDLSIATGKSNWERVQGGAQKGF